VVAGHFINPTAEFSNENSVNQANMPLTGPDDEGGESAFVPNIYLVSEINPDWTFGLGVNVPFGLSTLYDKDWIGRYHAIESTMASVNINPSVAFKASDNLSVGFGLNAQYVDVTLSSAVDFGTLCWGLFPQQSCTTAGLAPQANDGYAEITGDSWSYGWNAGLLYDLTENTRVGLAYRSAVRQDVTGEIDFTVPEAASFMTSSGLFTDTTAEANVELPDSLRASVYHAYSDRLNLMADLSWTGWSRFDELRIKYPDSPQPDSVTTENWNDTWRIAVGGNYRYSDALVLRTGVAFDQGPVPDAQHRTPRIPDGDRTWLSLGLGYAFSENVGLDFGYTHLFVPTLNIDNTTEGALENTLTGEYTAEIDIFSLQLRGSF
jgi:long-chain fatty acid transport protein